MRAFMSPKAYDHRIAPAGDFNPRCDNAGLAPCLSRAALALNAMDEARAILAENETIHAYDQQQHAHPHSLLGWPEGAALAEALQAFVNE